MIKKLITSYAVKRFSKSFAVSLVGLIAASKPVLEANGIKLEIDEQLLTAAIIAGIDVARNQLKHKFNIKGI